VSAEKAFNSARQAHDAAEAAAQAAREEATAEEAASSEDDSNGTANPRGTCLWSHKVKCEVGRRVFAQYGDDSDELWFRGAIKAVHRNEIGQYCDIEYDDGEVETMKPIKRVRAIDESESSDSDDDSDEE